MWFIDFCHVVLCRDMTKPLPRNTCWHLPWLLLSEPSSLTSDWFGLVYQYIQCHVYTSPTTHAGLSTSTYNVHVYTSLVILLPMQFGLEYQYIHVYTSLVSLLPMQFGLVYQYIQCHVYTSLVILLPMQFGLEYQYIQCTCMYKSSDPTTGLVYQYIYMQWVILFCYTSMPICCL